MAGAATLAAFEKTSFRRRLRGASAQSSSRPSKLGREAGLGAARAFRSRATGWDGASRSRSAGDGHGGARRSSGEPPSRGSSAACSGPQCGKQRPPDTPRCRRGPYQGRASCATRSVGGGCATVGPCWMSGAGDGPCAVRPRGAQAGRARRHAPVLISGLGKVGKSFGRVFQRRGWERSQGRPRAPRPPPELQGGSAAAGLPRRGATSLPYTRWHWCPADSGSFSPPIGGGGASHKPPRAPGRSPRSRSPGRCPSVGLRSSMPRRQAPVLISGLGKVGKSLGRVFQRRGWERSQGRPLAPRPPPELQGGQRRRRPAPPRATLAPIHPMALVPAGFWMFFPSHRGRGGQPLTSTSSGALAPLAKPQTVHLRRASELHVPHPPDGGSWPLPPQRISKEGKGGLPRDPRGPLSHLGLLPGHQGQCAAPCARLRAPIWATRRSAPPSKPP